MSKLLAIDTSTDACSAAMMIGDDIKELFQLTQRQHGQYILPMIDQLLAEAGILVTQLDAIAFGCGPGSFTGIRIASSVVQGIAFGANLPVIPISTLQAMAQGAYEDLDASHVLVALDARMQDVYWAGYTLGENDLMKPVIAEQLCKPADVTLPHQYSWLGVGDGWDVYRKELSDRCNHWIKEIKAEFFPHAKWVAKLAKADFIQKKYVIPEQASPVYLRGAGVWKKLSEQ